MPTAKRDKRGFSLVEVMIALTILLIVFLGMIHATLLSIDANMTNLLRDEATSIADRTMIFARNLDYGALSAGTTGPVNIDGSVACINLTGIRETPRLRNYTGNFAVTRTVTDRGTDNKQVVVTVSWTWKNQAQTQRISSIFKRPGI